MARPSARGATLGSWQRRVVAMGWFTYAAYYLGRVNISTAMPGLRDGLELSSQQVGMWGTGLLLTYAFGQLISGRLGDRTSPRKLVFLGMLLSAAMNLLFGAADVWGLMLIIWSLNGFFQSTGWAPIMKVLTNWHSAEQRRRVAGVYATSYVAGNAATWLLTGWLVASLGWRAAFWIPAALMGLVALTWNRTVRDTPQQVGFPEPEWLAKEAAQSRQPRQGQPSMLGILKRFWPLVLAAVTGGMLLFALILWAPTYFVDVHGLRISTAANISLLFPIAGTVGTLAVSWLVAGPLCCKEIAFGALVFLIVAGLVYLFPAVSDSLLTSATLLVLVGSVLYGVNTIITTILPMVLSDQHEVSSVAGLVDFAFNIGASLAGVLVGTIVDVYSWSAVFSVFTAGAIMTSVLLAVFAVWMKRLGITVGSAPR